MHEACHTTPNPQPRACGAGCLHAPRQCSVSGALSREGAPCPRCSRTTGVLLVRVCPHHIDATGHQALCRRCCAVAMFARHDDSAVWQPQQCYTTVVLTMLAARVLEELHDALRTGFDASRMYTWTMRFDHAPAPAPARHTQRRAVLHIMSTQAPVSALYTVHIQMYTHDAPPTSTATKPTAAAVTGEAEPPAAHVQINICVLDTPRMLQESDILFALCAAANSRVVPERLTTNTDCNIDVHIEATTTRTWVQHARCAQSNAMQHHCTFAPPHTPAVSPMGAWRAQYGCCHGCGLILHPPRGARVGLVSKYFLDTQDVEYEENHYKIENLAGVGTLTTNIATGAVRAVLVCAACRLALEPFNTPHTQPLNNPHTQCLEIFEYLRHLCGIDDLVVCALRLLDQTTAPPAEFAKARHVVAFFSNMRESFSRDIWMSPNVLDKYMHSDAHTQRVDGLCIMWDANVHREDYISGVDDSLATIALRLLDSTTFPAMASWTLFQNTPGAENMLSQVLAEKDADELIVEDLSIAICTGDTECNVTAHTMWVICARNCTCQTHNKRDTILHTHTSMFQVCAVLATDPRIHKYKHQLLLPRMRSWAEFDLHPPTHMWDLVRTRLGDSADSHDSNTDEPETSDDNHEASSSSDDRRHERSRRERRVRPTPVDIHASAPTEHRTCWVYRRRPVHAADPVPAAAFVSPEAAIIAPLLTRMVAHITTHTTSSGKCIASKKSTTSDFSALVGVAGTLVYSELKYLTFMKLELSDFLYLVWKKYTIDAGFVQTYGYDTDYSDDQFGSIIVNQLFGLHVSEWAKNGLARHISALLHGACADPDLMYVFTVAQSALLDYQTIDKLSTTNINTLDDMLSYTRGVESIAVKHDEALNGYATHRSLMGLHYMSYVFPRSVSYRHREVLTALRVSLSTEL